MAAAKTLSTPLLSEALAIVPNVSYNAEDWEMLLALESEVGKDKVSTNGGANAGNGGSKRPYDSGGKSTAALGDEDKSQVEVEGVLAAAKFGEIHEGKAEFSTWIVGWGGSEESNVYASMDTKDKVRGCKIGEHIQCAKVSDWWLACEGGGVVQFTKDQDGTILSLMYEEAEIAKAVAIPDWTDDTKELLGSFLQICHFSAGEEICFLDKQEVEDMSGYGNADAGVLAIEDDRLVLDCYGSQVIKCFPYQVEKEQWNDKHAQDPKLFETACCHIQVLGFIGFAVTPLFLMMGLHPDYTMEGKRLVYILYFLVFASTFNIALKFKRREKGTLESAMWRRLTCKPQRIPYFKTSLFLPTACLTFFTAIPSYTDHMVLALAIGDTDREWQNNATAFDAYWNDSWEHVPLLCRVLSLVTLPQVLCGLMIIDQLVSLGAFVRAVRSNSYFGLQSATSVASFLFLSELFSCAAVPAKGSGMKWGKISSLFERFIVKVVFGTELRLWFKVSLLVLMRRVNGPQHAEEVTLLIAIFTSFMHAATGSLPLARLVFDAFKAGGLPYSHEVYGMRELWGREDESLVDKREKPSAFKKAATRPAVLGTLFFLSLFPVWGSAARLAGAYLCPSYSFAFISFGCTNPNVAHVGV